MILVDTSGLLAAMFPDQVDHEACRSALAASEPPRLLSPFVLAELDYLILRHAGVDAELALLDEITSGVYELATVTRPDVDRAREIVARHRGLGIGLADASLAVLSERTGTLDLLTLDQRHFRTVPGAGGQPFHLLPADS